MSAIQQNAIHHQITSTDFDISTRYNRALDEYWREHGLKPIKSSHREQGSRPLKRAALFGGVGVLMAVGLMAFWIIATNKNRSGV
jgi:hypothetical protein